MENQPNKTSGGILSWFRALLGKPAQPIKSQTKSSKSEPEIPPEEDSIVQDIESLKSFVKTVGHTVSTQKVEPRKVASLPKPPQIPAGITKKSPLKNLIRVLLVVFFLLILTFIGIRIVQLLSNGGNDDTTVQLPNNVIPSPVPYIPHNPSVYAEDVEVLKLEEDILVLERELSNTNIKEDRLYPPTLDYNVRF